MSARTVSAKSVKTIVPSCAYCKEEGHFIRATRDPASAIICPVLKEKEKKNKAVERKNRTVAPKKGTGPTEEPQTPKKVSKAVSNRFADAFSDDEEEKDESLPALPPKQLFKIAKIIEFPELPTIRTTPVKASRPIPSLPEKSYAAAAIPMTPEKEVKEPVAPGAPIKAYVPPADIKNTFAAAPRRLIGRWADCVSSDEEDEDEEAEQYFA